MGTRAVAASNGSVAMDVRVMGVKATDVKEMAVWAAVVWVVLVDSADLAVSKPSA